ncbi:hypothetical protein L596_022137 [Steinernema carpocapsae]|uniref:Uncharacterized protein n=1 Tax=Steinernema carpocapsae TaxID=34508 RepID=A0A4U5MKT7_STECR|nr:hypothetical protein L596_022137 [Steinernema carpocapsae]
MDTSRTLCAGIFYGKGDLKARYLNGPTSDGSSGPSWTREPKIGPDPNRPEPPSLPVTRLSIASLIARKLCVTLQDHSQKVFFVFCDASNPIFLAGVPSNRVPIAELIRSPSGGQDDEIRVHPATPVKQETFQETAPSSEDDSERLRDINLRLDAIRNLDHLEEVVTEVEDRFLGIETSNSDGTMHFEFIQIARILAETSVKLDPLEDSWEEAARRNGGQLFPWLQSDCDRQMRALAKRLRFLQIALNRNDPEEAAAQNNETRSRSKIIKDRLEAINSLLELQLAVASMERKSTSGQFFSPEAHYNCRRQQLINAGEELRQVEYALKESAKNPKVLEMCWEEAVVKHGAELRLWLQADCHKELQALEEKLSFLWQHLAALQEDQALQVEVMSPEEGEIVEAEPLQRNIKLIKEPQKDQATQVEDMSPEEGEIVDAEPRQRNIKLIKEPQKDQATQVEDMSPEEGEIVEAEPRQGILLDPTLTDRRGRSGGSAVSPSSCPQFPNFTVLAEFSKSLDLRIGAFTDLERLKRFIASMEARAQNDSRRRESSLEIKSHINDLHECDKKRGRIKKMVSESSASLGKPEQWREEAERRLGARISTWTSKEFEAERKATYERVRYLRKVMLSRKSSNEDPVSPKRIAFHPLETFSEGPPKRSRRGILSRELSVGSALGRFPRLLSSGQDRSSPIEATKLS